MNNLIIIITARPRVLALPYETGNKHWPYISQVFAIIKNSGPDSIVSPYSYLLFYYVIIAEYNCGKLIQLEDDIIMIIIINAASAEEYIGLYYVMQPVLPSILDYTQLLLTINSFN